MVYLITKAVQSPPSTLYDLHAALQELLAYLITFSAHSEATMLKKDAEQNIDVQHYSLVFVWFVEHLMNPRKYTFLDCLCIDVEQSYKDFISGKFDVMAKKVIGDAVNRGFLPSSVGSIEIDISLLKGSPNNEVTEDGDDQ